MYAAIQWANELIGKDNEDWWSTFRCLYQMAVKQCVPLNAVSKGKEKHHLLLLSLRGVGIDGQVLVWIKGFPTNRPQRVLVNGVCFMWRGVWGGVPQGSIYGLTLFLVYVHYLLNELDSEGRLYAHVKLFRKVM